MSDDSADSQPDVDVVIPVYGERSEALAATLSACAKQTVPVGRIIVVDDGSLKPVTLPDWAGSSSQILLVRLDKNQGISGARNAGLARTNAPFVACINTEVLPDPGWVASCRNCLLSYSKAGACYTRLVSATPGRILTRWRMRFLETKFGEQSGPAEFAPGHAVLFRREALEGVKGYDVRHRLHHEDSDIGQRMWKIGWETRYLAESRCVSIQKDSLKQLAAKELRESYWYSPKESSLLHLYYHLSKWTIIRAGRNLVKGRIYFLPVDVAIWGAALWKATSLSLFMPRRAQDRS